MSPTQNSMNCQNKSDFLITLIDQLRSLVACQMCSWSWYLHWRWSVDAYPCHPDMFEVFCCPSTTPKHTSIGVKRRDAVAHRGAGVFQVWLRLRNSCWPSAATHRQASVCAERHCTADLQSLLSGPHLAVTAQITLTSDVRTCFVLAGSASALLPPWLCTWLPASDLQRATPQCTSTTALFDYISAGRSMPVRSAIGDCTLLVTAASVWNSLPESAQSLPLLQVFRSRLKTELFARSYSYD